MTQGNKEKRTLLTTDELAPRWNMHPITLAKWRNRGEGPRFFKIGPKVFYSLEEVQIWEKKNIRRSTVG
jgi:hypothetical protein